jgi:uncharacterized membrane protein
VRAAELPAKGLPLNQLRPHRLAYIDWMRGLACVLMFQTHCYDSWLSPEARHTSFFMYSQLTGTLPAPLFLFLAGISLAILTTRLYAKALSPRHIGATILRRGAEIFGFGILFRLQEYFVAWGWAPWSDLFRVDILNTIGMSIMLIGVMCWLVLAICDRALPNRRLPLLQLALTAASVSLAISLLTPPLWTTWRPRWLPWPLESYINGVHNLGQPQPWLFPIFPWSAFAFAGLATGCLLQTQRARQRESSVFALAALAGFGLIVLGHFLDHQPSQLYAVYDFWHTSPNFFLIRVGLLLIILCATYAWCRWDAGEWAFSPMIQLGQTSLLVYWVHIEFVYGRFSIRPKHSQSIRGATLGLMTIFLMMLALSIMRTRTKRHSSALLEWIRQPAARAE